MQDTKLSRRLACSPAGGDKACLLQRQAEPQPQSQLQAAGLRSEPAAQCKTWAGGKQATCGMNKGAGKKGSSGTVTFFA